MKFAGRSRTAAAEPWLHPPNFLQTLFKLRPSRCLIQCGQTQAEEFFGKPQPWPLVKPHSRTIDKAGEKCGLSAILFI
jgi:hypothetical protein